MGVLSYFSLGSAHLVVPWTGGILWEISQNHSFLVGQNHPPPLNPWLVVSIPLKNMKVSWDGSSQYGKIIKGSKPPTSQCLLSLLTKHPISSYSVESLILGHSHIHFRQNKPISWRISGMFTGKESSNYLAGSMSVGSQKVEVSTHVFIGWYTHSYAGSLTVKKKTVLFWCWTHVYYQKTWFYIYILICYPITSNRYVIIPCFPNFPSKRAILVAASILVPTLVHQDHWATYRNEDCHEVPSSFLLKKGSFVPLAATHYSVLDHDWARIVFLCLPGISGTWIKSGKLICVDMFWWEVNCVKKWATSGSRVVLMGS